MNDSFISTVDINTLNLVVETTERNVTEFTGVSDKLISSLTTDLDRLMEDIHTDMVENNASDYALEKYSLELSNMLYFMGTKLETMGIKDDLSKMAAKEVYNASYLDNSSVVGKKPTVAELSATAENDSRYETIMNSIYTRTYKQLKFKIDAGYEMLNTIRKVISKRMQDAQLSMYGTGKDTTILGREDN